MTFKKLGPAALQKYHYVMEQLTYLCSNNIKKECLPYCNQRTC